MATGAQQDRGAVSQVEPLRVRDTALRAEPPFHGSPGSVKPRLRAGLLGTQGTQGTQGSCQYFGTSARGAARAIGGGWKTDTLLRCCVVCRCHVDFYYQAVAAMLISNSRCCDTWLTLAPNRQYRSA